jgi:hypothetical protein
LTPRGPRYRLRLRPASEYLVSGAPLLRNPCVRDTGVVADDRGRELLAHARLLEQRDVDVALRIETVAALLARVDEIRGAAASVGAWLERIPGERAAVELTEQAAREHETSARHDLADAERRLEETVGSRRKGKEARAAAQLSVRRASEALAEAVARVGRAEQRSRSLVEQDAVLRAEAEGLAVAAHDTATAILGLPSVSGSGRSLPGVGIAEIEDWGGRAHAALFVVRGGLEAERQRVVDEANALGAAVLREELAGASVALVRRRLEAVLS